MEEVVDLKNKNIVKDIMDSKKSSTNFKNSFINFLILQDFTNTAIGIATGTAFVIFTSGLVNDFFKPFLNLFLPKNKLIFNFHGSEFKFGDILEQFIIFIIFFVILYYLLIVPLNYVKDTYGVGNSTTPCPYCKTIINPESTKCRACSSDLPSGWNI